MKTLRNNAAHHFFDGSQHFLPPPMKKTSRFGVPNCALGRQRLRSDGLQDLFERWFWSEAHGSISVQEGQPPETNIQISDLLRRGLSGFELAWNRTTDAAAFGAAAY
jgi:hypothetical protein